MKRCPITYEECGEQKYSEKGLKALDKRLHYLNDFPYTPQQQLALAAEYANKLSIQGVQPKLSVRLNVAKHQFEVVAKQGRFIVKPPHFYYLHLPENEDLTMRLARGGEYRNSFTWVDV